MMGRSIYHSPYLLADIEKEIFKNEDVPSRQEVVEKLVIYLKKEINLENQNSAPEEEFVSLADIFLVIAREIKLIITGIQIVLGFLLLSKPNLNTMKLFLLWMRFFFL